MTSAGPEAPWWTCSSLLGLWGPSWTHVKPNLRRREHWRSCSPQLWPGPAWLGSERSGQACSAPTGHLLKESHSVSGLSCQDLRALHHRTASVITQTFQTLVGALLFLLKFSLNMIFVLEQRLIIHLCLIHFPSDIHVCLFLKGTVRLSVHCEKGRCPGVHFDAAAAALVWWRVT